MAFVWGDEDIDIPVPEEEGWISVTRESKPSVAPSSVPKQPRWCLNGNACEFSNCVFRHDRCAHYDAWVARGKRGHNCRAVATDPRSNKKPADGGCKYDHRDYATLKVRVERVAEPAVQYFDRDALPIETLEQFHEAFVPLGLELVGQNYYSTAGLSAHTKFILGRTMVACKVATTQSCEGHQIKVDFETESDPEVVLESCKKCGATSAALSTCYNMCYHCVRKGVKDTLEHYMTLGLKKLDIEIASGSFFSFSEMLPKDRDELRHRIYSDKFIDFRWSAEDNMLWLDYEHNSRLEIDDSDPIEEWTSNAVWSRVAY